MDLNQACGQTAVSAPHQVGRQAGSFSTVGSPTAIVQADEDRTQVFEKRASTVATTQSIRHCLLVGKNQRGEKNKE